MSDNSKNFIIVIGRQYGSGGRRIASIVAEKLGVPYYDKKLLSEASERFGFSDHIFSGADEKRPSFLRSLLQLNYGVSSADCNPDTLSSESIYNAQSNVIRQIAESGSCVMVGRTADYVMRHHPNILSVFIHAPVEKRAELIMSRGERDNAESAAELAKKIDRERESYYNYFTSRRWGHASNYHLCIDSSSMDFEQVADLIIQTLKLKCSI